MKKYPFKFLDAYDKNDTGIFFGRDEEINALYEMVFQSPLLLIYGASGTGKTSLIQCGLASKFQSHDWLALTIRRGNNINAAFEKALADAGGNSPEEHNDMDWLKEVMGENEEAVSEKPTPLAQSFKSIYLNSFRPVYLIFDQFEELFILGSKSEQDKFIETVQDILKIQQPVKMIFCIREEYLGFLYEFETAVPQLLRKKLRVEPMNLDKVRQVIIGSTSYENSNVRLKAGETDAITKGIFDKIKGKEKTLTIQLPYLQVFLDKFYLEITKDESRQAEAVFSEASLADIGDIGDVLRDFLEEQVSGISRNLADRFPGTSVTTIWNILSPFATLEGTKEPIGKQNLYARLPGLNTTLIDATIDAFINSRILRYAEEADLYEIAHDSLAKRIAEKRSDEEIALLEVKRLIKSQASLKADARELFSEKQLNFIEPYLKKIPLADDERALLDQSHAAVKRQKALEKSQQEAETERLRERQLLLEKTQHSQKRFIRWIGAACIIMVGLAIWAYSQKMDAESAKKEALRAQDSTQVAYARAEKLIRAFYFFDGKFALAFNETAFGKKYGFINKDGDVVIPYKYAKAEQFEYTGLAKVSKIESGTSIDYLIDTAGKEYRAAFKIADLNKSVTALDLEGQKLSGFPQEILKNTQLEILLLPNNLLGNLPAGIDQLKNLQVLDLTRNSLNSLPTQLTQLISLRELYLRSNHLTALPEGIGQFNDLRTLDVNENKLTVLSPEVAQLQNLRVLALSSNKLTSVPEKIGELTNLQLLELNENALNTLPSAIEHLKNLKVLNLGSNHLTEFPAAISHLLNLQLLDLTGNQLTVLPQSVAQLKSLTELYLGANQINMVTPELGQLRSLQVLDLGSNLLTSLPPEISGLKHLEKFYLGSNHLAVLPVEIGQLSALQSLYLSSNKLDVLTPGIAGLQSLQILEVSSNPLRAIPSAIGQLKNLQELYLVADPLTELPAEIGQAQNLHILDLSRDSLKALPAEIGQLKNLNTLYLSSNPQLTIAPTVIGQLAGLKKLYLVDCKISAPDLQQIQSALPLCRILQ